MGRMSVKPNKSVYQVRREELELSREEASELTNIPADRIEKLENERAAMYPEDVMDMARGYKAPWLCNYYCSKQCAIGINNVPELEMKDLRQITLEMLAKLNKMRERQDRLIEISVDGRVNDNEIDDFVDIQQNLQEISDLADTLNLWIQKTVENDNIDMEKYNACRERKKKQNK